MPIQLGGNTTVRELAGRYPQTRTIFERMGSILLRRWEVPGRGRQESHAALPDLVRDIETALVQDRQVSER